MMAVPVSSNVAGSVPASSIWDLAEDFRRAPDQSNPSPDGFGDDNVWSYRFGYRGSSYQLLRDFSTRYFHTKGLQVWWGDVVIDPRIHLPEVGVNATGHDVVYDGPHSGGRPIYWPLGEVLVHPLPDQAVVIGWRSPISGDVTMSGDLWLAQHPNCGNGIDWVLQIGDRVLRSGTIGEFDTAEWSVPRQHVRAADAVYLIVDAKNDYACDSTVVRMTIKNSRVS
jgi:hypothetical protein